MKVSVETKGELERRLSVTVRAEDVGSRYREELSRAAKDVRLKGFRPGHVPNSEIERRFGARLRKEVALDVARGTLPKAIAQESLTPVTAPVLELADWREGRDLHFHATFECMPDIQMIDFSDLQLVRPKVHITEEDIDRHVQEMCRRFAKWEVITDRVSQEGDRVSIDFELKDPDKGETISAQSEMIQGVKDFSEDPFALPPRDGLTGVSAGEELEFTWEVPQDYPGADIAGRELSVRYTIREVQEQILPDPEDEELLERLGMEDLESLRRQLKESMERNRDELIGSLLREQGLRRFSESMVFSLPEGMVRDQMGRIRQEFEQMRRMRELQGMPVDASGSGGQGETEVDEEASETRAREYVKAALLLRRIVEDNELRVPDEELEQEVRRRSQAASDPRAKYQEILEDEEQLVGIEWELRQFHAMQYIVDHATLVDRDESYDSLMQLTPKDLMPDLEGAAESETHTAGKEL